jgi:L-malate glycosyltransferase
LFYTKNGFTFTRNTMPLKILLLSDTYSEHTEKWALALAAEGYEIGLFSLNNALYPWYNDKKNVTLLFEPSKDIDVHSVKAKLKYIFLLPELKKAIRSFQPDILHAHYATSFGLMGALSGFHPFVLSVWGEDVYKFPNNSFIHKAILKYNFRKADRILSTSEIMKKEVSLYTNKEITVTPFGVDTKEFSPRAVKKDVNTVYIGSIKSVEDKYGIKYLIEAARILEKKLNGKKIKMLLLGGGNKLDYYQQLIVTEKLEHIIEIPGRVPFSEISTTQNLLDIFINVSVDDSESFGVAVVEAMACEKPVIVSNVGGLTEVVNSPEIGIVIPKESTGAIVEAIEKLVSNEALAKEMGKKARQHVLKYYDFKICLDKMTQVYKEVKK